MQQRLQKILSQAGVASRRAAEKLIAEGRVTVNGTTVREMGIKADAAADDIRVDGRRVQPPERQRYILLNKPAASSRTRSDPQRRPTVIDLLGRRARVRLPGGAPRLRQRRSAAADQRWRPGGPTHPPAPRRRAHLRGPRRRHAGRGGARRLRDGIPLDGHRTLPAEATLLTRGQGARAPRTRACC